MNQDSRHDRADDEPWKAELKRALIDLLFSGSISYKVPHAIGRGDFHQETSLINDLLMDSIQVLEYLAEIESKFDLSPNYDDLDISIFHNFDRFVNYYYARINNR